MADYKCPNCGGPTSKNGDRYVCTGECGGSFEFKAGEAKVTNVGEIDALKADVEELKKRLPASQPSHEPPENPQPAPKTKAEPDEDSDEDDEDL